MSADGNLRFPLRRPVVLLTSCGTFLCRIVYAGTEHLVAEDVTQLWESIYAFRTEVDEGFGGTVVFARRNIVGYRVVNVHPEKETGGAEVWMKAALDAIERAARRKTARLVLARERQ